MEVVKIVMIGITGVLLALFLKESKPEYSIYLSFAVGICILGYAVEKLSYLFESIKKIQEFLPVDEKYVLVLLKMTGATYIGQFSSSICKDAGYAAIAGQIELFVKLYLMVLSLPVLLALVETIHNFLL
ncbi:SpoIIIAC/SpoIIIAD family protein [Blautia stercoris]|jgi:stage III sporulation protein AD|nr:SpoIIIAC/SpoIIIAD family protein [Blautia stercoris]